MELSRRKLMVLGGGVVAATGLAPSAAYAHSSDSKAPKGEWLAGDTHVHNDHSSDGSLPRQTSKQRLPGNLPVADQIGQAERMGLDFLPLTDHRTYDQHWDPQWKSSELLLVPGEEANGSPHAIVLGAVDTVVDGANPPGSAAFRHVQQSVWDAHAQDAVWSTAHPDNGEYTPATGPNDNASVQGVNLVEVWNPASDPDAQIDYAENRWNRGFRFGVAAASDCHFRELWGVAGPGEPTTWVFAAERSVRGVLDALRAGRTTVSYKPTGAFLTIEADLDGDGVFEALGGDEVVLRDRRLPKRAALRVRVRNGAGSRVIVYRAPGRSVTPVTTVSPTKDDQTFLVPVTLDADQTWFRAELRAPGDPSGQDSDPNLPDQLRAIASPVFVSVRVPAEPTPEIALPTQANGADHAALALGEEGEFTGFADVAVQGDVSHVVAELHRDGRTTIGYTRMGAHGDPQRTVELSGNSPTARFPRIAVSGNHVWVVWQDERGREQPHQPDIYLRHSRDGGRSFESAVRLTDGAGRAEHPALALVDAEHPVVVWADNSTGPFDVYARVVGVDRVPVNLSGAGKTTDGGTADDARSPRFPASLFPSVTVGRDRRVVVTWQDNRFDPDPLWTGHTPAADETPGGTDPDNWQILASVRVPGGRSWTEPARVSASAVAADRHPSVAADRDGTFVVVWETKTLNSSGANLSLRASRSTDGGRTWSTAESFAVEPAAMSQRPRLGQDQDGRVRAVWYDSRSTDWRWQVFTAKLDHAGRWTAPTRLSVAGNGTWPAVSGSAVVFTSDRRAERTQRDWTQQVFLVRVSH
ncbi:CehA/McbA family metallohydrolase [Micromonospora sp. NPDC050397]|uniref:CehA/McbA family metallohydrolase n=1 Tax=Micromonospora sp. NPDC050397 TaxID=3364279 RepID=UPI00384EE401